MKFYHFRGPANLSPHFYCDTCSNLYFNYVHHEMLCQHGPSKKLLVKIAASLPDCPCGGSFKPGANPKCPHCRVDLREAGDVVGRMSDPFAIQVQGAALLTPRPSAR